jgi:hypothetical protein
MILFASVILFFDTSALVKYFHAELIKIADEIAGIRQRTGREKPSVIT